MMIGREKDDPFSPERMHELGELEAFAMLELLKKVKESVLSKTTPAEIRAAIEEGITQICDDAEHHSFTALEGIVQRRDLAQRLQGCSSKQDFETRFQTLIEDIGAQLEVAVLQSDFELGEYHRLCELLGLRESPLSPLRVLSRPNPFPDDDF